MRHNIRLQSWGRRVVVVCENCTMPGRPETALLRSDDAEGPTLADAVAAAELHVRAHAEAAEYAGTQVAGQTTFGPGDWEVEEPLVASGPADGLSQEEDLVAGGPVDEFPPGYHPRTGQKITEVCMIPGCGCSGEAHP